VVIVPVDDDPPTTLSTDQAGLPLLAVNCCVPVKVNTEVRGVMLNPVPVPDRVIVCGLPGALSVIITAELRAPVVVGVKVTLIVHEAFSAKLAGQLLV
jgi:hypothetical protein